MPGGEYVDASVRVPELVATIREFLGSTIGPGEFSDTYQRLYQDLGPLDAKTFEALDRLFFVCEDFYDDPALRDPGDPDEAALRAAAERALADLGGA